MSPEHTMADVPLTWHVLQAKLPSVVQSITIDPDEQMTPIGKQRLFPCRDQHLVKASKLLPGIQQQLTKKPETNTWLRSANDRARETATAHQEVKNPGFGRQLVRLAQEALQLGT